MSINQGISAILLQKVIFNVKFSISQVYEFYLIHLNYYFLIVYLKFQQSKFIPLMPKFIKEILKDIVTDKSVIGLYTIGTENLKITN